MKKLLMFLLIALLALQIGAISEAGRLPGYVYQGDDPYLGAVCDYILNTLGADYAPSDVSIPCAIILEKDDSDVKDVKLWGIFEIDNYDLFNTTLVCQSGGETPGLMHLESVDGELSVKSMDAVGDGSAYVKDLKRIFGKRKGLLDRFYDSENNDLSAARLQFVSDYVKWNGLNITQMQDSGWDPVALIGAPETPDADQIVHYTSKLGYSVDYDLRLFSYISYGDQDEGFMGVDELGGILMEAQRMDGKAIDEVIKSLSGDMKKPVTEEATIGADGVNATCVRDAALEEGATDRNYVLALEGGCLVLSLSNTYYAEDEMPVVDGGEEALEGLLATFRLG